jgi:predicted dehydrogenase
MAKTLRFGVLGAANIAVQKVVPAMRRGRFTAVTALASRDRAKGEAAAQKLGIARVHGSYEELLADPEIDAVYNPLPNHLHVPWSIRALEAGKHVLCEKPIGLSVAEVEQLLAARDRTGRQVQEAFMVRTHPQWLAARDAVRAGRVGELRAVTAFFSYFNQDAKNIRNVPEYGGGALMDVGCYPITIARFLFGAEPRRVSGCVQLDVRFGTDRLTSAVLEFEAGHAIFTCSTQSVPYQRVQIVGTTARIEMEIPFNAPPDRPVRIFVHDGKDLAGASAETLTFDVCDQYTIQGDLFAQAILENRRVPLPLEDALGNARVIAAVFRSAESGRWEAP